MKTIPHLIGGKPVTAYGTTPVFNPATGEQTAALAAGGKVEIMRPWRRQRQPFPAGPRNPVRP